MIAKDKEVAAMKALQAVLIRGRTMAYAKDDYAKIVDLLDAPEYLAGMLYEQRDMTETFREMSFCSGKPATLRLFIFCPFFGRARAFRAWRTG